MLVIKLYFCNDRPIDLLIEFKGADAILKFVYHKLFISIKFSVQCMHKNVYFPLIIQYNNLYAYKAIEIKGKSVSQRLSLKDR